MRRNSIQLRVSEMLTEALNDWMSERMPFVEKITPIWTRWKAGFRADCNNFFNSFLYRTIHTFGNHRLNEHQQFILKIFHWNYRYEGKNENNSREKGKEQIEWYGRSAGIYCPVSNSFIKNVPTSYRGVLSKPGKVTFFAHSKIGVTQRINTKFCAFLKKLAGHMKRRFWKVYSDWASMRNWWIKATLLIVFIKKYILYFPLSVSRVPMA